MVAMEWRTTSTLLEGLREFGRDDAWSGFVERFRRPIVAFARRLGHSADDAEDIAQETLVVFAQSYRDGRYDRTKGRLSHWLFGIAYRQALKERERGARRQAAVPVQAQPDSFLSLAPDERAATHVWDREWERSLLDECLSCVRQEVEPTTYAAFEMTVVHSRPAAEVAEALGVAVTAVYNAKHRVVQRLRDLRDLFEAGGS
jgi:RNA polymerase sigma-70 factor (ECF subfamily)